LDGCVPVTNGMYPTRGLRGRSGPPGNQNAFRHGLAGIAQRRTNGTLNSTAWLFHQSWRCDVHQPLRTIALFMREYPHGDRGGNEVCVRVAQNRAPITLRSLWDNLLTSSRNPRTIRNSATKLRSKFSRAALTELANTEPKAWAKESFEIAKKIAYRNGAVRGTPKGQRKD
jgi:S1/P1 nuclease